MLQTFSFDGSGRQIDTAATFFRYESAESAGADESLRVYADGNDLGTYLPGDAIRLPIQASRWVITPASSSNIGTVRLGLGLVESARLVGTVRVIDQSTEKTLAGLQFFGLQRQPAVAGKAGLAGVIAGANRLSIKKLMFSSATAGLCQLFYGTAAPTDTYSAFVLRNKLMGAADSSASRWIAQAATTSPTSVEVPGKATITSVYVAATGLTEFSLTTPIVLPAGTCLGVASTAVNTEVGIYVDAEEV